MKKTIALFLLFLTSFTFSQSINVEEISFSFSNGKHNSLSVSVPYAQIGFIMKNLKGELKDWKGKYKESKGEHSLLMSDDKEMGDKPFDVYAKVVELNKNKFNIVLAIDLGGAYLNSKDHKDQYLVMEKKVKNLALNIAKKHVDKQYSNEKGKLKDLQKESKNLDKEREKLTKQIEDYNKRIKDNIKRIEEIKSESKEVNEKIKDQDSRLKKVEDQKKSL